MPREVVDVLKKSGHWREGADAKNAATPASVARSQ